MLMSKLFAPTVKEIPQDAEIESHRLMLRAGFIRKLASGIYSYLPLAMRVLTKIISIIREEHAKIVCQELLLPAIHPAELWQETGRWNVMGATMFRLKDRHFRDFCLGMTHEEVITWLVAKEFQSYKQLPVSFFQIQTKFRDEPRPRSGVIRAREFLMKDAYSFHTSLEDLDRTYKEFHQCYLNIFKRCGLNVEVVEADTGAMGGIESKEFMVMSDAGEDTIFWCGFCNYAANGEIVECPQISVNSTSSAVPMEKVFTPNCRTIDELVKYLKRTPKEFIKTLLYDVDGEPFLVLLRGDREINESKLGRALGASALSLATQESLAKWKLSCPVGFLGPVGLDNINIIADYEIKGIQNAICGANEVDYHYVSVSYERDFYIKRFADLRYAVLGDSCPNCGNPLVIQRGIELGHIFKLGIKYSAALKANFLDEKGEEHPMIMGCYGIGVSRMLACLIEQQHDKDGIIWPANVAPYQVYIVVVNSEDEAQNKIGNELYDRLQKDKWEVILDERRVRAGVKFKDADLIGIPIRVTVGTKAAQEKVEIRIRRTGKVHEVPISSIEEAVKEEFQKEMSLCSVIDTI